MDYLRHLFVRGSEADLTASTADDEVYPLYKLDDSNGTRNLFLTWVLRFNDVLDAQMLHDSLSRLLEIGDWRKLGGRLRLNNKGELEIHAPRPFTPARPAIAFGHDENLGFGIEEHSVAQHLPKQADGPYTAPLSVDFRPLIGPPGIPTTIKELISQDAPQLRLHITSFNDATLVALSWPHTLMDAMGYQALLKAWSLVLLGRETDVPAVCGAKEDVLRQTSVHDSRAQEKPILDSMRVGGLGWASLVFRYLLDRLMNPGLQSRVIFLPAAVVNRLKTEAQEEVFKHTETGGHKPLVSTSDALAAWAIRSVAMSEPRSRPITVMSAFNARFSLPKMINPREVHVQNMFLEAYTLLNPQQEWDSLGQIALAHRRQLTKQTTEEQTLSLLRSKYRTGETGRNGIEFFGPPDALPIILNDLTKADIVHAVDFAAAVVQDTRPRDKPPGTAVYHHFQVIKRSSLKMRNVFVVLGKDRDDNYWLVASLAPRTWAEVEEGFNKMQSGH